MGQVHGSAQGPGGVPGAGGPGAARGVSQGGPLWGARGSGVWADEHGLKPSTLNPKLLNPEPYTLYPKP